MTDLNAALEAMDFYANMREHAASPRRYHEVA
jgi:hypothetical protein